MVNGINFKISIKDLDFSRVKNETDRKIDRALGRLGGYTRKVMRNSIKSVKSEKPSAVGKPPRNRTRRLKNSILYAYSPAKQTVVIGAALNQRAGSPRGVAHIIEYGGTEVVRKERKLKGKRITKGRSKGKYSTVRIKVGTRLNYKPRPFARPALAKSIHKLADFLK